MVDHDGKNDATEGTTGSHDAEGEGAAFEKPCARTAHGRVEDHGGPDGRADASRVVSDLDEAARRAGDYLVLREIDSNRYWMESISRCHNNTA